MKGEVKSAHVRFQYESLIRPVLNGVDLEVKAGETLAIVGPSGSGKTTLMALLMRFYDPQEGTIFLDGRDLRAIKQRSLRCNIGTVPVRPSWCSTRQPPHWTQSPRRWCRRRWIAS